MTIKNEKPVKNRGWPRRVTKRHQQTDFIENPFDREPENKVFPANRRFVSRKRGTYATIDLGTNNCRMLIAQPSPHSFRVVESFSRITRLGEGLVDTGMLSEEAIVRTIKALKICETKLKKRPVSQARHLATEACRRASNSDEFIRRVHQETGITLEIITEEEEARLAISGCIPLINRNINHTLVFDIGGGSTEISWAKITKDSKAEIQGSVSLPFGVVTVSEAFTGRDIDKTGYSAILKKTTNILSSFEKTHKIMSYIENGEVQMIGTSGTVTTIAAIHLELPYYNRQAVDGLTLRLEEIEEVQDMLKKMSHANRLLHPCIGPQRADLTLAGCAILEAICSFWPMGEITVADRGLREGVLLDLMQRDADRVKNKETQARKNAE